jgi:hypothetical protein
MYRNPHPAPRSRVPAERRGATLGRFCLGCGSVYPKYRARHAGKPLAGKDHVASPCLHEGEPFEPGASWWEPAVEVLPPPAVAQVGA